MDESWRAPLGPLVPRRRSTEQDRRRRRPFPPAAADCGLEADDFRDVFGGPPRTVLLRRFSGELPPQPSAAGDRRDPAAASFYDEVFRPAAGERLLPRARGERSLPGFRIPAAARVRTEEGFYDDIFGSNGDRRSRSRSQSKSKSKSNSSSVLSSEGLSPPFQQAIADDTVLSSFASKLRPITIPSWRNDSSPPSTLSLEDQNSHRTFTIPCGFMDFKDNSSSNSNNHSSRYLIRQRSHIGFCCFSPPETISLEPSFRRSLKKPLGGDSSDADSPSSVISSVFLDHLPAKAERDVEKVVLEVEGEREAVERTFVIGIDSHGMGETEGAAALDEAIAWAKEKFWNPTCKVVEAESEQLYSKHIIEGMEGKENHFAPKD